MNEMLTNNVNNANLVTDAEPTLEKQGSEYKTEEKSQPNSSCPNPKSKKKGTNIKNVTNVYRIKNTSGVHFGPNISISLYKSQEKQNTKQQCVITEEISKLMHRNDSINEDIINIVSTHVGEHWRMVCRKLGYSDGQIFQFEELYRLSKVKEIVYRILKDWTQNKPDECRVGTLVTALWEASERDVVDRLVNDLKS